MKRHRHNIIDLYTVESRSVDGSDRGPSVEVSGTIMLEVILERLGMPGGSRGVHKKSGGPRWHRNFEH